MITIDYTPIRRQVFRARGVQYETFYRATCECSFTWEIRKSSAGKIKQCCHCARSQAGRKGYQTTCARYGRDFAYSTVQCSAGEVKVAGWLRDEGIAFTAGQHFQLPLGDTYVIDFVVGDKAIELTGYWHQRTKCEKDLRLMAAWPGRVMFADAQKITKREILYFLNN